MASSIHKLHLLHMMHNMPINICIAVDGLLEHLTGGNKDGTTTGPIFLGGFVKNISAYTMNEAVGKS